MAFTPNSRVHMLYVPFDVEYKNIANFSSTSEQLDYMVSRIKHSFEGLSYQRKDNAIRVPSHIDSLWNANYVMYQNSNFGSRWFYAFITKMEYVNDALTLVYISTDVWQTWQFDVTIRDSFVIREHVNDDSIGANLVDEGLDTGEYIRGAIQTDEVSDDFAIIMAVTEYRKSEGGYITPVGKLFDGVYSALHFYSFTPSQYTTLNTLIEQYVSEGKAEAIVSIFMTPWWFFKASGGNDVKTGNKSYCEFIPPQGIDGYTPKNNKLYNYPYRFIAVNNCNGTEAQFMYEYFSNPAAPCFTMCGSSLPPTEIMCYPENYKGLPANYAEKLVMSGFPTCAWGSDVYKNWLAQNKVNLGVTVAGIAAGAIGGGAYGVANGALKAADLLGTLYERSKEPNHAKGQAAGNVNAAWGLFQFQFMPVYIKAEYAKRIDSFFEMYGYKVNTVKKPNLTGRPYWNYVQTVDINAAGDIPTDDMARFKTIFNEGTTIWHNPANIGNYSLNNH